MAWGSQSQTTEETTPKYGREHMRAVFERQKARQNRTPIRMALVGKENTCKTGLDRDWETERESHTKKGKYERQ